MGAIAPIYNHSGLVGDQGVMALTALTNSATVATDGSFTPTSLEAPGVLAWEDQRDTVALAWPRFTMSFKRPQKGSGVYRMNARLVQPVMESNLGAGLNGIVPGPTEAYRLITSLESVLPARSTTADRRIHLSMLVGLLVASLKASDLSPTQDTGSPVVSAILNLQGPY